MRAVPYYCHDCKLKFTIYWTPVKRPSCPNCEDKIAVKRNPYPVGNNPEKIGTRKRWTDEEKAKLLDLYNNTSLTWKEIAALLGKTDRSARAMHIRLK